MVIKPEDVPDKVLDTLLAEQPSGSDKRVDWRDGWRSALALTLTAWEGSKPATYQAHECRWKTAGSKNAGVFGIRVTYVLQRCTGCGTLRTTQLQGEWTPAEVADGRQS
jgi:hypothetical protein